MKISLEKIVSIAFAALGFSILIGYGYVLFRCIM